MASPAYVSAPGLIFVIQMLGGFLNFYNCDFSVCISPSSFLCASIQAMLNVDFTVITKFPQVISKYSKVIHSFHFATLSETVI
jgi:ATP phosphoribosyltransferase